MTVDWNSSIRDLPGAHVLQTDIWAAVKARNNWQPIYRTWGSPNAAPEAAAMTLVRRIPMQGLAANVSVAYAPRGPLLDWSNGALRASVLSDMILDAKKKGAIFLKIDPEVRLGTGVPGAADERSDAVGHQVVAEFRSKGWVFSQDQVQYRNTVMVDLTQTEDELLAGMKQKTRYNVRLAGKRGVNIRRGDPADFEQLFRMYADTSARDGFIIREQAYYLSLWKSFFDAGMLDPLIAEVDGEAIGAVVIFRFGGTAVYMHGMSANEHREKMPNYLLQWEGMRTAKAAGCARYDLWGAPDQFTPDDGMWGVYRFKEGFNGTVVRHIGAWDYPIRPLFYRLYTNIFPKILEMMRRRGTARTALG